MDLPQPDRTAAGQRRDRRALRQLDRGHIEGYLAFIRARPWRGQRATAGKGRAISAAVAQSAVLSLRNMLNDIAAWGWPDAPSRGWCAADVPKLSQPLTRALPPDADAAIMNAVADLDDDFACIGLTVLRDAGLRAGELLDLEVGSIIDDGRRHLAEGSGLAAAVPPGRQGDGRRARAPRPRRRPAWFGGWYRVRGGVLAGTLAGPLIGQEH